MSAAATPVGAIRHRNEGVILEAAEEVFANHGYRGASLQVIADAAGLPKSNILYYFGSKRGLYVTLLERTMTRWNALLDEVDVDDDPAEVLSVFIRTKMELARRYPRASRLFANEILHGAPHLQAYLRGELRAWVMAKAAVLQRWIEDGRMDSEVDPVALIFLIWSATQHYADFEAQVLAITGRDSIDESDHRRTTDFLCHMILKGCGLDAAARQSPLQRPRRAP